MNKRIAQWIGAGLGVVVLALMVSSCSASCESRRGRGAEVAGAAAKGASGALKGEADATGVKVAEADTKVTDAAGAVKVALEGLQKLRKPRPATQVLPATVPPALGPAPSEPVALPSMPELPDPHLPIIAQQEVVISAMQTQISEMEKRDLLQKAQVRQLEGALRFETEARVQAELRVKAAEGLARANLWKGRAQGFLGGLVVGGAGGVVLAR